MELPSQLLLCPNRKSKIKNLLPLCLSSDRASFVNSYSSVRVRPGAPFQWWSWCNSSTAPRDGVSIGANPFGHPNFDRRKLIGQEFPRSAFESGLWCNSSISAREADGPGANPGFLTKKENARRALKEIGLSASGYCSRSNPSPGTMISTPVFGSELFVAHDVSRTKAFKRQRQVIQSYSQIFDGPLVVDYHSKMKPSADVAQQRQSSRTQVRKMRGSRPRHPVSKPQHFLPIVFLNGPMSLGYR